MDTEMEMINVKNCFESTNLVKFDQNRVEYTIFVKLDECIK